MCNQGFYVEDDNEPAKENVPTPADVPDDINNRLYPGQTWGWRGIDQRQINVPTDQQPGWHSNFNPASVSWVEFFLHIFPTTWLKDVLLAKTSATLEDDGFSLSTLGSSFATSASGF